MGTPQRCYTRVGSVLANIKLGLNNFPEAITLAYLTQSVGKEEKSLITMTPGHHGVPRSHQAGLSLIQVSLDALCLVSLTTSPEAH
jgi:hypothetical protein